jgi:excisionase family DNA binding protein
MRIKDLLTPKQLAEKMKVTEPTVSSWIELGLPTVKLGKFRLIFEDSFLKWLKGLEKHQDGV